MRSLTGLALAVLVAGSCGVPQSSEPAPASAPLPRVGQPGKDVVWVPSPERLVDAMLDLASVTSSDFVIDLGSGDGRTVLSAARRGAKALGIEFNPDLVAFSRQRAKDLHLSWRAAFEQGDIFTADLSRATVVSLFLSSEINLRLRPRLLDLAPGTRIVSNTFSMADWEPDATVQAGDCASWCEAMLWTIPAKAGGTWRLGGETLTIDQQFQRFTGTIGPASIDDGRVRGEAISFAVGSRRYSGEVRGATMSGVVDGRPWSARRTDQSARE